MGCTRKQLLERLIEDERVPGPRGDDLHDLAQVRVWEVEVDPGTLPGADGRELDRVRRGLARRNPLLQWYQVVTEKNYRTFSKPTDV